MSSNVNPNRMTKVSIICVAAIMLSLSVSGCGSKYGPQTVKINHYPNCYKPINDLRKDESDKTTSTVFGAILGGIAGGVVGYQATNDAKGVLIGGVAGAIIGGTVSHLITEELQKKTRAERFAAYSAALDTDLRNLQLAVAAAKVTSDCYEKEYKKLNTLFNADQISNAEMKVRLEEMRSGTNDANAILTSFAGEVSDNQLVYTDIKKREIARASSGLSPKELQVITNKSEQLQGASTQAQQVASRLTSRSHIYSSRLNDLSNTAQKQLPTKVASMPPQLI